MAVNERLPIIRIYSHRNLLSFKSKHKYKIMDPEQQRQLLMQQIMRQQ
jgi:hypothetical protein